MLESVLQTPPFSFFVSKGRQKKEIFKTHCIGVSDFAKDTKT